MMEALGQDDATQLASELKLLLDDAEELLRSTAGLSDEAIGQAREKFRNSLDTVRERVGVARDSSLDSLRRSVATAEDYARSHPWWAVGAGMALGVVVGVLSARR
jgi:ElaB/YqjD/DUF883 family membrane-anchored ribosome-binding protein